MTSDGHLIEGILTGGHIHDVRVAENLFEDIFSCYVVADRGYDANLYRQMLIGNNNVPVIPGRKSRKNKIYYDKTLYTLRSRIEMFFGKLKENKRLCMRFEKRDDTFIAFISLAAIKNIIKK